jgi:hypothetical protein
VRVIRVSREAARACCGCGKRAHVLTMALGLEHLRLCDGCFARLCAARQRLIVEQLDSIEIS